MVNVPLLMFVELMAAVTETIPAGAVGTPKVVTGKFVKVLLAGIVTVDCTVK